MKNILKILIPFLLLSSCARTDVTESASESKENSTLVESGITDSSIQKEDDLTIIGDEREKFERLAASCNYSFDPKGIKISQRKTSSGEPLDSKAINELLNGTVITNEKRFDQNENEIHKIFYFAGALGKSNAFGVKESMDVELFLWEDGLLSGSLDFEGKEPTTFGGVWWNLDEEKKDGTLTIRYSINDKVLEEKALDVQENDIYFKFGIPHGPNILLNGDYYYPDIGIVIYNKDVGHEVIASPNPNGEEWYSYAVYRVDKSLSAHYVSPESQNVEYIHIPSLRYPNRDEAKVVYKGMEAFYSVNVTQAEGDYSLDASEAMSKTYSLFDRSFLRQIKLMKDGLVTSFRASDLHYLFDKETSTLSVYLPDGKVETVALSISSKETDNKAEGSFGGINFDFTFKSFDTLEVKAGDKQLVLTVEQYNYYHSDYDYLDIIDWSSYESSLLETLPKTMYGIYLRSGNYLLYSGLDDYRSVLERNYI